MSATEAITAARTAGVRLTADGEDLLLDAASPPSVAVIDTLSRHKAEVLKLLRPAGNGWAAADWHAFFDERAGIAEFDDGLSRSEAEDHAFTCSVSEWLNRNPITSPPGRCLACGDREYGYDPLLPYGVEPTGHAWLHSRCWEAWRAARKREAAAALEAMGLGSRPPTDQEGRYQTLWLAHSDDETRGRQFSATITALIEIGPKDEIEGMIAAQLIAAHNATMECYRRAMIGEQTLEGRRDNLSQANKLSRTYAVLLDALNRYRGKEGQQKVTVEHVDVHAGGQAVVGMIESPRGGDQPKSEDQPRAKQIGHAPQPAVWSADKERQPLPVSGDAERPLPDARRDVPGCPEG